MPSLVALLIIVLKFHKFNTFLWLLHYLLLSLCSKPDNSNAEQFQLIVFLPNPMAKISKNILTLNHEEAMDFFMKSEEYLPYDSIINKKTLKNVTPVITFRRTRAYNEQLY